MRWLWFFIHPSNWEFTSLGVPASCSGILSEFPSPGVLKVCFLLWCPVRPLNRKPDVTLVLRCPIQAFYAGCSLWILHLLMRDLDCCEMICHGFCNFLIFKTCFLFFCFWFFIAEKEEGMSWRSWLWCLLLLSCSVSSRLFLFYFFYTMNVMLNYSKITVDIQARAYNI